MKYLNVWILCACLSIGMGCDKNANSDTVCYTMSERQCAMDPYQPFIKDADSQAEKIKGIEAYFKSKNILDIDIHNIPPSTNVTCQACICPSGISYKLQVQAADTLKLKALGLSLTYSECN